MSQVVPGGSRRFRIVSYDQWHHMAPVGSCGPCGSDGSGGSGEYGESDGSGWTGGSGGSGDHGFSGGSGDPCRSGGSGGSRGCPDSSIWLSLNIYITVICQFYSLAIPSTKLCELVNFAFSLSLFL